ncbi:hypothetical protein HII12_003018 [Brettanomyces bruxellensis]|uniref:Uncharacterized protein n=1 Tax=Dekkera bruxellensis TaxID=5007 RepID=A0A8H6BE16_DEKBR|nr:hypothetical protein HII12_003018 [Brettanomyces bruxellensis]
MPLLLDVSNTATIAWYVEDETGKISKTASFRANPYIFPLLTDSKDDTDPDVPEPKANFDIDLGKTQDEYTDQDDDNDIIPSQHIIAQSTRSDPRYKPTTGDTGQLLCSSQKLRAAHIHYHVDNVYYQSPVNQITEGDHSTNTTNSTVDHSVTNNSNNNTQQMSDNHATQTTNEDHSVLTQTDYHPTTTHNLDQSTTTSNEDHSQSLTQTHHQNMVIPPQSSTTPPTISNASSTTSGQTYSLTFTTTWSPEFTFRGTINNMTANSDQVIPRKRPHLDVSPSAYISYACQDKNFSPKSEEENEAYLAVTKTKYKIPRNYNELLESPERSKWEEAIQNEMDAMKEHGVYTSLSKKSIPSTTSIIPGD